MRLTVGKMIGSPGGKFWGQVHDFVPEDGEKVRLRGRLTAVVSIEVEEDADQVEVVKTGREILTRLQELYFGSEEQPAMKALGEAVEKLEEEFGQVAIAALVTLGEYGYVCAGGGAGVWVKTSGKQGFLVQPEQETGKKVFSGKIREGMMFLLGDGTFWHNFPAGTAGSLAELAGNDMDAAVETLTESSRGGMSGGVAGLVFVHEVEVAAAVETEEVVMSEPEPARESGIKKRIPDMGKFFEKLSGSRRKIYINYGNREEQRRKMKYLGLGLLGLLLLMVGLGPVLKRGSDMSTSEKRAAIEKLAMDFKDASAMAELNPIKSRELLTQIKEDLKKYEGEKKPDARVVEVQSGWEDVWSLAMGIVRAEPVELIDLSLVREGIEAGALAWSNEKLYALDVKGFRVIEIDVTNGSGKVAGGGTGMSGSRLMAGYPGKQLVISEKGIVEVGIAEPRIAGNEITNRAAGMELFGGNIYLLDPEGGEIWRYAAAANGFSAGKEWLAEGEAREEIKQGMDLAIDGSIWVLESAGIEKFTRGVREGFEVKNLEQTWKAGSKIFTNEEMDKIYVLDPGNFRIIVIGKDGEYQKQYVNDTWVGARDLVVDDKAGKIFLAIDGKVWAVNL